MQRRRKCWGETNEQPLPAVAHLKNLWWEGNKKCEENADDAGPQKSKIHSSMKFFVIFRFYGESSCTHPAGNCLVSNPVSPWDIESHPGLIVHFIWWGVGACIIWCDNIHYLQLLLEILNLTGRLDCPFHRAYRHRIGCQALYHLSRDNIQYRSRQIVHSRARALPPDKRSTLLPLGRDM